MKTIKSNAQNFDAEIFEVARVSVLVHISLSSF